MQLPDDFIAYLRCDAPGFGGRGHLPVGFELWDESDLESFNTEYEVSKHAAGFYGIGSHGDGEMLAFGPDGKVYALPFPGMEPKAARLLAACWTDFQIIHV